MWKDWAEVFKKISLDDLANDYVIKYRSDSISDYLRQREIDNLNSFLNYEKVLWTDPVTPWKYWSMLKNSFMRKI